MQPSADQLVYIVTALAGAVIFMITIVKLALDMRNFIASEFKEHRRQMYLMFSQRDRAIRRLEFWAVKLDPAFQPGADPMEFANGKNGPGQ